MAEIARRLHWMLIVLTLLGVAIIAWIPATPKSNTESNRLGRLLQGLLRETKHSAVNSIPMPQTLLVPVPLFGPNNQIWMLRETFCALLPSSWNITELAVVMPPLFPHFSMKISAFNDIKSRNDTLDHEIVDWLDAREWLTNNTLELSPDAGRRWWLRVRRPLRILYIGLARHRKSLYTERLLAWMNAMFGIQVDRLESDGRQVVSHINCHQSAVNSKLADYDLVFHACFNRWINYKSQKDRIQCPRFDKAMAMTQLNVDALLAPITSCIWNGDMNDCSMNQSTAFNHVKETMNRLDETVAVQLRVVDSQVVPDQRDSGLIHLGSGKRGQPRLSLSIADLAKKLHLLTTTYNASHLFMTSNMPPETLRMIKESLVRDFNTSVLDTRDNVVNPLKRMMVEEAFCVRARVFIGLRGSTLTENVFLWRHDASRPYLF